MSEAENTQGASIDPDPEQFPLAKLVAKRVPIVNAGFNWEWVKQTYDPDPEGTLVIISFVDKGTGEPKESMAFTVEEGPRLDIIGVAKTTEELRRLIPVEDYRYIGEIVTYRGIGFDTLDSESKVTPWKARYQYDAVNVVASDGESRERVWMVGSQILNVMLKATQGESE